MTNFYALVNGIILDGTQEMEPVAGKALVVENDIIKDIVPADQLDSVYPDAEKVDVKGCYITPGLINLHVHTIIEGSIPKNEKPTDYKALVQRVTKYGIVKQYFLSQERMNVEKQLLSGVTTLRAVGGIKDWDGITRDRVNRGEIPGPRILSANMAISVPGGHFAGSLATESDSVPHAIRDLNAVMDTNPDFIKLMITGGVMDATEEGEPGALRMPPEMVKACCDEAHRRGFMVAAHVESQEGVRVALQGGVDTIEHGATPDDEIIELYKKNGSACVCTISPVIPYVFIPREISKSGELGKKNGSVVFKGIVESAKECLKHGIPVGLGTDTGCPFITHYDMWREVGYFAHFCDVTPAFALYTATLGNASIIGMQDEIGSLEVGKQADYIVVVGNPLEDLSALRNVKMVARAGNRYVRPVPKRNASIDKELDEVKIPTWEEFLASMQ